MVKLIDGGELTALQEENNRLFIENKALSSKLDSETNRANHEERLRRTAETCAGSMSKSLEDEIRNNAELALEADHQRKCAKEWFNRMQAAESRLDEALKKLYELENIEKAHHESIDETDFFADKLKETEAERNELQRRLEAYQKLEAACREWRPISEGIAMENSHEPYDDPIVWALAELDRVVERHEPVMGFPAESEAEELRRKNSFFPPLMPKSE